MKRLISIAVAAIALIACAPQAYVLDIDMRKPSSSGVNLDNKTMAIVYLENGSSRDSLFNNCFADGFAQGLEAEYFNSEKSIPVYNIVSQEGSTYTCKDSLENLVMRLNADVVMMIDAPSFSNPSDGKISSQTKIFAFDSMDKSDKVRSVEVNGRVTDSFEEGSLSMSEAQYLGLKSAAKFVNSWKTEQFTLLYMEKFDQTWVSAVMEASDMKWAEAMDKWMALTGSKDEVERSCAAFNLATACHITGQDELAIEWLDLSDKTFPISVSASLRKKILQSLGR